MQTEDHIIDELAALLAEDYLRQRNANNKENENDQTTDRPTTKVRTDRRS